MMLVSLISRLVACSSRIVVDKQTDRQTDTQNDYCNPRCACAPRVNYETEANDVNQSSITNASVLRGVLLLCFSYSIFLTNPGEYIILMSSVPRSVMVVRICSFFLTLHSRNPDKLSLSFVWCIVY